MQNAIDDSTRAHQALDGDVERRTAKLKFARRQTTGRAELDRFQAKRIGKIRIAAR
jgi:hypothetical protein